MKTEVDCLPCFVRQALQVARIAHCDETEQIKIVQEVAKLAADLDMEQSPPANAVLIYRTIADLSGCNDPYRELKVESNLLVEKILPDVRRQIAAAVSPWQMSIRLAIAGNSMDYGAFAEIDITKAVENAWARPLIIDHLEYLQQRLDSLKPGASVLYLADNCGEIMFDRLVMEDLAKRGFSIFIAVKDGPIINDALFEDAILAGLDNYGKIISNGSCCPGTVLSQCSAEFLQVFHSADLIISKGQGNFESLSNVDREIFFLLLVKCPVAGRHLAALSGTDVAQLPGKGEMVVFCLTKKKI
jgi:uncharacterized protein with ATP-grasp and redox domains